jgi:MYXO-CTERM domain-containing protein
MANLKYVGVTSNLPDMQTVAASSLYFGMVTWGLWGSVNESGFNIAIRKKGEVLPHDWHWVLYTADLGYDPTMEVAGTDNPVTQMVDLTNGNAAPVNVDFFNGVEPDFYYLPAFLTDSAILSVPASLIGLTDGASEIEFEVDTYSPSGLQVDSSGVLTYDLAHPAYSTKIDPALNLIPSKAAYKFGFPPLRIDATGGSFSVTYDMARAEATNTNGLLLIHHLNAKGKRGEVVQVNNTGGPDGGYLIVTDGGAVASTDASTSDASTSSHDAGAIPRSDSGIPGLDASSIPPGMDASTTPAGLDAAATATVDSGTAAGPDASTVAAGDDAGSVADTGSSQKHDAGASSPSSGTGCGCSSGPAAPSAMLPLLLTLGFLSPRTRRRPS